MYWILAILYASMAHSQVILSSVEDTPVAPAPFPLIAPTPNAAMYDIDMSPYAGGEDLLFGFKGFERGLEYIDSKMPISYAPSMAGRFWRLLELTLVYLPLGSFVDTVQHEVFGHGFRIRDLGNKNISVKGYTFKAPPPYGDGGGATSFRYNPDRLSPAMLTTVSMAGIEAETILSSQIKMKWLFSGRVDPRQASLYIESFYSVFLYGSLNGINANHWTGHDLNDYTLALHYSYGNKRLLNRTLKYLSFVNLLDPFTYYACFSWFRYINSGKETKIPMIPIKNYGYLFGAHMQLTPFGPEFVMDNYLIEKGSPIYFYIKGGHLTPNNYWGAGYFIPEVWQKNGWSLGVRLDTWLQPRMRLNVGTWYSTSLRYGAAASLLTRYRKNDALGWELELGYKSDGFLPGYSLYKSPVVRAGYLATF